MLLHRFLPPLPAAPDSGSFHDLISGSPSRSFLVCGAFLSPFVFIFCLFLIVKAVNKVTNKDKEEKPKKVEESAELKTLKEIRDLLKDEVQSK